jgi:drug/metabolite transporter (DMT)-like permease
MIKILLLVLLAEIVFTIGHIFLKKAANRLETPSFKKSHGSYLVFVRGVLGLPAVWWGIVIIGLALVIWLAALSYGDLSFVYPAGSLQYLLALFAASIFLKDKIDFKKIAGTLLIVFGIVLMTLS